MVQVASPGVVVVEYPRGEFSAELVALLADTRLIKVRSSNSFPSLSSPIFLGSNKSVQRSLCHSALPTLITLTVCMQTFCGLEGDAKHFGPGVILSEPIADL